MDRRRLVAAGLVAGLAAVLLSFLFMSGRARDAMDRYDWLPTESAPLTYPMEIVRGDLVFPDGSSIYIPDKKVFHNGWGELGSTHVVGDETKPVPGTLDITWFSYTEDKFYAGVFELPSETMLTLFNRGFVGPVTGGRTTYHRIIVGLAPGGHISVWLAGEGIVVEVAAFTAAEANVRWRAVLDNDQISRADYVRMVLEETLGPEGLARLAREGVPTGLWERYRRRYPWTIEVVGAAPISARTGAFNGERENIDLIKRRPPRELRAVPRQIKLDWRSASGRKLTATFDLDEPQVFQAFEKLMAAGDPAKRALELRLVVTEASPRVRAFLSASGDPPDAAVELPGSVSQVYTVD